MALAKHHEEIAERRAMNDAHVIFEYQHPHRGQPDRISTGQEKFRQTR